MARQIVSADGVTGLELITDDTMLHTRPVMNNSIRGAILERNKLLRNDTAKPLKDLSFGRMMLSFPELDYWHIRKKYPDLFEGPIEDKKRALQKFLRSPESLPYRVQA